MIATSMQCEASITGACNYSENYKSIFVCGIILFLNIGAYVAGQSNCICILDIIWSGYALKTLKPEITCLQAITIYSTLRMGKWCIVSWREMFISFQLLPGRDSDSSSNSVIPIGLYVWPQIDCAWLTLNRACILQTHACIPSEGRNFVISFLVSNYQPSPG